MKKQKVRKGLSNEGKLRLTRLRKKRGARARKHARVFERLDSALRSAS